MKKLILCLAIVSLVLGLNACKSEKEKEETNFNTWRMEMELSVCFTSRWCYATYSDSSDEWSPHLLPTTAQEGESERSVSQLFL